MAWQVARRRRAGRSVASQGAAVAALAEELRAALRPAARAKGGAGRSEWTCGCGVTNWTDRPICRGCAAPRPAAPSAPPPKRGSRPPYVAPRPPRPWGPSPRLGQVAEAALAAGASQGAVEALRQDAAARRAERQTAGGRLDAARAKVARVTRQAEEAREALAAAERRAREAEQAAQAAEAELAAVEAAVAAAPAPSPPSDAPRMTEILGHVRDLLDHLERAPLPGHVGSGPALPARVLASMDALRQNLTAPPAPGSLDEPLATEPGRREEFPNGADAEDFDAGSEATPADEVMDELANVDEHNVQALAAIARRLKRARHEQPRAAPY